MHISRSTGPVRLAVPVFALAACVFGVLPGAEGQALPAATRQPIQIGAEFSTASADYGYPYIQGVTLFADAALRRRFGAEAEFHDVSLLTPTDIGENSILVGPRFDVLSQDRFRAYVKALGGIGLFSYQAGSYQHPHTDSYGALALGGGFEYRATRHWNVRVIDVELQNWPGFAPHGLSPVVFSFGAAYIP